MGMRSNLKNTHTRDIKDQLNDWYPTLNFDIVLKCWRTKVLTMITVVRTRTT